MILHENEVVATASLATRFDRTLELVWRILVFSAVYYVGMSGFYEVYDYLDDNSSGVIFGVLNVLLVILGVIILFFCFALVFKGYRYRIKIIHINGRLYFKRRNDHDLITIKNLVIDGDTLDMGGTYHSDKIFKKNNNHDFSGKYTIAKRFRQNLSEFYSFINKIKES